MNALDAFGLLLLALFRRAPKPAPVPAAPLDADPLAESVVFARRDSASPGRPPSSLPDTPST